LRGLESYASGIWHSQRSAGYEDELSKMRAGVYILQFWASLHKCLERVGVVRLGSGQPDSTARFEFCGFGVSASWGLAIYALLKLGGEFITQSPLMKYLLKRNLIIVAVGLIIYLGLLIYFIILYLVFKLICLVWANSAYSRI
jgi:hypothetical protein